MLFGLKPHEQSGEDGRNTTLALRIPNGQNRRREIQHGMFIQIYLVDWHSAHPQSQLLTQVHVATQLAEPACVCRAERLMKDGPGPGRFVH